jgi:protocatechuate 3,4-dioxygenase beta subunit
MNPARHIQFLSVPDRSARLPTAAYRWVFVVVCVLAVAFVWLLTADGARAEAVGMQCRPTAPDSLGPFYKPGAPQRERVGSGYRLEGTVRSAQTCLPIPGARIEFWMAGPDGKYDDAYRATVVAQKDGAYHFESHYPKDYFGRPPHIHVRISADGFNTLITQHYPLRGARRADFDFVLRPRP